MPRATDYPLAAALRTVAQGLSGRQGLAAYRVQGGRTTDSTWYRMLAETRRNIADRIQETQRPLGRRPTGTEVTPMTTRTRTGFWQQVEVFHLNRNTGEVESSPFVIRGQGLLTRQAAIAVALEEWKAGAAGSVNPEEFRVLGAAYTGTLELRPGPAVDFALGPGGAPEPKPTPVAAPAPETLAPAQRNRAAMSVRDLFDVPERDLRAELAKALGGTWPGGIKVDISRALKGGFMGERSISMEGGLLDARGRQVGRISGDIHTEKGRLISHHDYLQISPNLQGSGFSNEFMANLFDWYARSGVNRVEVLADIDVGGYAWAAAGFDFADRGQRSLAVAGAWRKIRAELSGVHDPLSLSPARMDVDQLRRELPLWQDVSDRIERGEAVTPYEISQLGRQPGQGGRDAMWIGKFIMLGSTWNGHMKL